MDTDLLFIRLKKNSNLRPSPTEISIDDVVYEELLSQPYTIHGVAKPPISIKIFTLTGLVAQRDMEEN